MFLFPYFLIHKPFPSKSSNHKPLSLVLCLYSSALIKSFFLFILLLVSLFSPFIIYKPFPSKSSNRTALSSSLSLFFRYPSNVSLPHSVSHTFIPLFPYSETVPLESFTANRSLKFCLFFPILQLFLLLILLLVSLFLYFLMHKPVPSKSSNHKPLSVVLCLYSSSTLQFFFSLSHSTPHVFIPSFPYSETVPLKGLIHRQPHPPVPFLPRCFRPLR